MLFPIVIILISIAINSFRPLVKTSYPNFWVIHKVLKLERVGILISSFKPSITITTQSILYTIILNVMLTKFYSRYLPTEKLGRIIKYLVIYLDRQLISTSCLIPGKILESLSTKAKELREYRRASSPTNSQPPTPPRTPLSPNKYKSSVENMAAKFAALSAPELPAATSPSPRVSKTAKILLVICGTT